MSLRLSMLHRVPAFALHTILFSSVLAACGGGGGGGGDGDASQSLASSNTSGSTGGTSTQSTATEGSGTSGAMDTTSTDNQASVPVAVSTPGDTSSTTSLLGTTDTTVPSTPIDTTIDTTSASGSSTTVAYTDLSPEADPDAGMAMALSVAATASTSAVAATGFYVDSVAGSDLNPGTSAQPFKTLNRLGKLRLTSGQNIYLKCNGLWRENLYIGALQLIDGTTFGPYGTDCNTHPPRITGSNDFSKGWTVDSNGVWSRSVPAGTPKINRLFVNDYAMRTAQWPNAGSTAAVTAASTPTSTNMFFPSAADKTFLAGKDLVGATALITTEPWSVDSAAVSGYSATKGEFDLSTATHYNIGPNLSYVLTDKLWMLDAEGEFYHDTATNMLYVKPTAAVAAIGLNNALVEGAVRDVPATIMGRNALAITGLRIDMGRQDALQLIDAPNAKVTGVIAEHSGRSGIRVVSHSNVTGSDRNATIISSTIYDNSQYGLDAYSANRVTLSNSVVNETGTLGYSGNTLSAVWLSDGGIADSNQVLRSSYVGIRFSGTDGSVVNNNDVTSYCTKLMDCGAIYTWNGTKVTANQSSTVTNNRVGPGVSTGAGLMVAGIYLDDFTIGSTVNGNSVQGSPVGIYLHNGSSNTISANKVWMTSNTALWANMDRTDGDAMTHNSFTNNELFAYSTASGTYPALPKYSLSYALRFSSKLDAAGSISNGSNVFSGNTYLALQSGAAPILQTASVGITKNYTINQWKELHATTDQQSAPAVFGLTAQTLGTELQPNGTFDQGTTGWRYWNTIVNVGSMSLAQTRGCTGDCVAMLTGNANDSLFGQGFNLTGGGLYVIKYKLTFGNDAMIGTPFMTLSAAPYSMVYGSDGLSYVSPVDGAAGDSYLSETYFHAIGDVSARNNLKVKTPFASVSFDNVSVKQVTSYSPSKVSEWASAVIAPASGSVNVSCASLGWGSSCTAMDSTGTNVSLPVTIAAGSSRLLLRSNSPLRQ